MAILTSNLVSLSIGGEVASCPTSMSLKLSTELKDTQCSASNGWKRSAVGNKSWEMSLNMIYTDDGALTPADIVTAWLAGTTVAVAFTVTGGINYEGDGYITNVDINGPENADPITVSVTITGDDELSAGA